MISLDRRGRKSEGEDANVFLEVGLDVLRYVKKEKRKKNKRKTVR